MTVLYANINTSDGMDAVRKILDDNSDDIAHNCLILKLLELILTKNIFEFDGKLFVQNIGTSMGAKPAPDYANIISS